MSRLPLGAVVPCTTAVLNGIVAATLLGVPFGSAKSEELEAVRADAQDRYDFVGQIGVEPDAMSLGIVGYGPSLWRAALPQSVEARFYIDASAERFYRRVAGQRDEVPSLSFGLHFKRYIVGNSLYWYGDVGVEARISRSGDYEYGPVVGTGIGYTFRSSSGEEVASISIGFTEFQNLNKAHQGTMFESR